MPGEVRTIEELREDAQRMNKTERAVKVLDELGRPAPAHTIASQITAHGGMCADAVAAVLKHHPQVEAEQTPKRKIYSLEVWGENGGR